MSNIDYVLRDNLDTLNSTLKEILSLLRDSVPKEIVVNNIVTSQNERELSVEENNQIAVNISNAQRKRSDSCQIYKQVYKESIATKTKPRTMVKVGIIGEDGILEFHRPDNLDTITIPSVYSRGWFIEDNDSTKEVLRFKSVFPDNFIDEIITNTGTPNLEEKYPDECNVTGYITDDGRAVYYDQYI